MARNRTGIDGQEPLVGQVYLRHHMTQATHTLAFQAAIDALPAAGGEIILDDINYTPTVASLSAGARKIRWTGNGTVNGAALWGLPGQQVSYRTALGREIRYVGKGATTDDFAMFDWRRNADYTGGLGGTLNHILRLETTIASTVGSSGQRKEEDTLTAISKNFSNHANGVAFFPQAVAEAQGAVWAVAANTLSKVVPATYAHRAVEANIEATGADGFNLRWIVDIVSHRAGATGYDGYAVNSVAYGLHIAPNSADMKFGARIGESVGAGTTKGQYLEAGLLIERVADGDLAQFMQTGAFPGAVKIGSGLSANNSLLSQVITQGRNASNALVNFTDLRSRLVTNTAGAEEGRIEFYGMVAGALTLNGSIGRRTILLNLPTYADEAAALAGGLTTGTFYKNASNQVLVKA
jgi:hypothetical protein